MRKLLMIIATVGLGSVGMANLAVGHELPGQGCAHAKEGANKHCGPHAHGSDPDGDGVVTRHVQTFDNCSGAYNPKQGDFDGDGIGNVCDHTADDDDDGGCDLDAALCGTADPRVGADAPYANDTDGDGLSDKNEDGIGAD